MDNRTGLVRLIAVNVTGLALVGGAATQGWIADIWHGDSSRITVVITVLFLVGLYLCLRRRDLRNVRWIASALVMLGLIGTVVGFIQALLGIDPNTVADTSQIGKMVASLVNGMGTALWTTFVGAVFNLWLLFNVRIIEAHRGA